VISYLELKRKHQEEVNSFPMAFAFSKKQFIEAMEKLGLQETDTNKVYSIGGGGMIRKTDSGRMSEMVDRQYSEMQEARKDAQFLFEMFDYELSNHEYVITYDTADTLRALGITQEEVDNDPIMRDALHKAIKAQHAD